MDIFNTYATDTAAEEKGIWEPNGDAEFLIARTGNPVYSRTLTSLATANKRLLDAKGPAAEAKGEEIVVAAMAAGILLGWRGNVVFQGEALEPNLENRKKLLAVKDFRAWVEGHASSFERFKAVKDEEEAKN